MLKERLFTVRELAEYLSLNEETIRRWIKSEKLPALKIGRELRVKESEVEKFLEASEKK